MSLAKELAFLANPDPKIAVIEEDIDDTAAKLTEKGPINENIDVEITKLKRQAVAFDEEDSYYAGKAVSRSKITTWDERKENPAESGSDESTDDEMVSSCEESENEIEIFQQQIRENQSKDNDSEENASSDSGESNKSELDDDEVGMDESNGSDEQSSDGSDSSEENNTAADASIFSVPEEDNEIQQFSATDRTEEIRKGHATKMQLKMWDSLLESRIRLQKSLVAVNRLPQSNSFERFAAAGGEEFDVQLKESQTSVKLLLDQLVQLQSLLMLQYPDMSKLLKQEHQSEREDSKDKAVNPSAKPSAESDEEIPSDDDVMSDNREQQEDEVQKQRQLCKRKIKMGDYPEFLAKRHKLFQPYRDDTIQKWCDKTRIAGGKLSKKGFSAFESSAVKQIQQILSDKNRLVKRTQLKRSTYKILGKNGTDHEDNSSDEENTTKEHQPRKDHLKDYDEEIFDDDDFYHQLLRQLIERKTSDVDDPVALTRQWLEIQKIRSKVKRKVDTRASKGRKIRFDIHTKLINFMAPNDNCQWTDEARNDLFSSLFGIRNVTNTDDNGKSQ